MASENPGDKTSDPLQTYLQANLKEAHLESQGSFTLSVQELLRKVGSDGLYHPANWTLFTLRAMVNLGCSGVDVAQSKDEFWWVGHGVSSDILDRFENLDPTQVLACSCGPSLLARAVGALLAESRARVSLALWQDGERCAQICLEGDLSAARLRPTVQRQGYSLGLYVCFPQHGKIDLSEHLGYPLQYCPIPVRLHTTGWFTQVVDLRGSHWLTQKPRSPAFPSPEMAQVVMPLCSDFYRSSPAAGPLLLKPCGGESHAHKAAWCDGQGLDWLEVASALGSVSSLGRYYEGPTSPARELKWSGRRTYFNSEWGEKGVSSASLTTCRGSHIVLVSLKPHPDQIVPIRDGVTLAALSGQLDVPGVTLISAAPPELSLDLTGFRLIHNGHYGAWLRQLRQTLRESLEVMTEVPPRPPLVTQQPSMVKTMLATGGISLAAGTLCLGLHPQNLFLLTHGGIFGGSAVSAGFRLMRDYLPERWREQEQLLVEQTLKERYRAVRAAQKEHG